jgi:serine/threonine protein phosphatase 1
MKKPKRYVIGDVHGCLLTLKKMLFEVLKIEKYDEVYFLGDYIDRGPRIKETIDLLLELKSSGYNLHFLMGNHENMLINTYFKNQDTKLWYSNDGRSTLASFGLNEIQELPEEYLNFFDNLKYYFEIEGFVLTHAGLNFDIENPYEDTYSMLWTRSKFVNKEKIGGRRLISGHTPHLLQDIFSSLKSDKIQLDGGCVYYNIHAGAGYLVALELDSMTLYPVQNVE